MAGLLSSILGTLGGKRSRPLYTTQPMSGSRYQSTPIVQTRAVRVLEVQRETPDAVTVSFTPVGGEPLSYRAGQFVTFVLDIDGTTIRRAYSFSSSPATGSPPSVTVKRVVGGKASSYFQERVKPGHVLHLVGPSGDFTIDAVPSHDGHRHFVFVAGGSGITPIISLTETLLLREANLRIHLIYGNRSREDTIFYDRLATLAARHPNLAVMHVFERPPAGWEGASGLLTGETLIQLVGNVKGKSYYLCGPEPMMESAVAALSAAGVPLTHIKMERFLAPHRAPSTAPDQAFALTFSRTGITVTPKPGQSVLEAGLAAGVALPFSCTMGGCGACKIKLAQGRVVMDEPNCLSEEERKQGFILSCVSRPASPLTIEA